ncbi:MAG TPA: NaeI family type II restriction endonuclease [Candidatus Elarobacter sp.]|nr:NaeI family type II restriction endonuclease [Candidatus Elarobacter sp.]
MGELHGFPLQTSHADFPLLAPIVHAILEQAGGFESFAREIPQLIRQAIDEVIDTPRTNRFVLSETEKTEKTYLGTKVEILVRAHLKLGKGRNLDLSVRGAEVDIKNTMGGNWAIPLEAVGHPCILVKENEKTALCSVGLIVANDSYLNPGSNRDHKRTISAAGLMNVWWILRDHPYPQNVWEVMPLSTREAIMKAPGGAQRLAALFRAVQERPVSRSTVEDVAQQKDAMKRVRRNGGARDILAPQGIAILWAGSDRAVIEKLGLPAIGRQDFISYRPTNPAHIALLRDAGHID